MPKPFYPLLIVTVTTLSAVIAHSQLPPTATRQTSYPGVNESRFNTTVPVCYIQLENGQLRDLRQLCGQKSTGLPSSRSLQRPVIKPTPDSDDDDDSTPPTPSIPQTTPSSPLTGGLPMPQVTPPKPSPQPTSSPQSGALGRPMIAPSPATPNPSGSPNPLSSPAPSVTPTPLAIPDDDSRY